MTIMTDKRDSVVCIAAHAKTWDMMKKYCFNAAFRHHRDQFDLCVVVNGGDALEGQTIQDYLAPEYLVLRENTGLDQGAFDAGIKRAQGYDTYILMHYDHHFSDYNWFPYLHDLLHTSEYDVIGNIVTPPTKHLPDDYAIVAEGLGFGHLKPENFPGFLQGCAGFYKKTAIQCLLDHGGLPRGLDNNRNVACICERLQSFIMLHDGLRFGQIPPGYEKYLRHAEHI